MIANSSGVKLLSNLSCRSRNFRYKVNTSFIYLKIKIKVVEFV